jgi:hypothetical protein
LERRPQASSRLLVGLYRHAARREDLLDGVADAVLSQLAIPTDPHDWASHLRTTAHRFRRLALEHPHVVPLLVTRPLRTPLGLRPLGTVRPLEQMLTLLTGPGFPPTRPYAHTGPSSACSTATS